MDSIPSDMQNRKIKDPELSDKDLGFGQRADHGRRALNKDGTFNVVRKGIPLINSFETYHRLISMSWLKFNTYVLMLYFFANILFAAVYMLVGIEGLQGIVGNTFADKFYEAFFFSAQTLTTVGYGRVSPIGHGAGIVAAIESMAGLLGFALATGLLYGRFSRPEARIRYSDHGIIAPYKKGTAFMFRIVNERKNQLIEVEAALSVGLKKEHNSPHRSFHNLKLELTKINFFPLNWTLVHPIDEHSPLWGLKDNDFHDTDIEFISLIKAFDDTFSQTVYSRSSFKANEVVWGARFRPMTEFTAHGTIIHIDKINEIEKAELPSGP
jgi:inward rectifier potassium channel